MISKNVRAGYLYVICFITLMMIFGGVIATVNAVANYIFDLPTLQNETQRIRSIINSSATWVIAAPFFAICWWQITKIERKKEVAENDNLDID